MYKLYLGVALSITTATAANANDFWPDPDGKYEVMEPLSGLNSRAQELAFNVVLAGSSSCAPQVYVDDGEVGFLNLTVISPCHSGQLATLFLDGVEKTIQISRNGAFIATVPSLKGEGQVSVGFADGEKVNVKKSVAVQQLAIVN